MTHIELVQLALAGAGVIVGGGVWFRLGALVKGQEVLTKGQDDLGRRVTRLENRAISGGFIA
ncbi:hypothetical protein KBY28_07790 [Ruegeria pomeroyi]|uniref:hypothetical protein n=1 Tax=Ruegeria pomeroyi TaxID=89184 RepID=UPI001F251FAC|nr:hypothetical protein [Ruegeria pomeroyi]MCE8508351.1 hypothetical protein [Ruegeria pomeroyi]